MNVRSAIVVVMLLVAECSEAQQWYHSSLLMFNRDANAVQIFNRNAVLLGGGLDPSYRAFYNSNSYGNNWNLLSANLAPPVKSLAFRDSLNGIAAGFGGTLLRTADAGIHWTDIIPPVVADFNKVFRIGTQTLFVAGGNRLNDSLQVILKSTDNGNSWNIVLTQPGKWLKAVCFTDTLHGVVVGDSATILKTINGGNSWAPVASPVQRDFNAIAFVNDTTGFITGGKESNDSTRTILKTTDGGATWSVVKDELGGWLKDLTFLNQNTGYAVGDKACLLKTTDGGQTWNQETLNGATGSEDFNTVKFYDPNFAVVGGKTGNVFVYTDATAPVVDNVTVSYIDSTAYLGQTFIHTNGTPVTCSFTFSSNSSFIPQWTTYYQYLTGDTSGNVNIYLSGLTPNTTYYCRFTVTSILGVQFFDTLSFFTYTPRYTVQTDSATNVNLNWAQLNGTVNKCFFTGHPYFEYGLAPDLSQGVTIHCIPANITDTLLHTVSANLMSLAPDTTYYFTLMLQTPYGFVAGDTFSFKTRLVPYTFQTQNASDITDSSATLNAIAAKLPVATNVYFDYGLTPSYGSTISATPNFINDTLTHSVSAHAGSLIADTIYYFRLRGTTGTGTYNGSPFSFYTGINSSIVQSLPASNVTEFNATLNGAVDKLQISTGLYFEYGRTPSFGQTINSSPYVVNDTLPHSVTGTLSGLQKDSLYYYRLKGSTLLGDYNGNTVSFYARNPYAVFATESASGISGNNAQLNGLVEGLTASTTLSFEYGTTPALGSQITATPALVNDSFVHSIGVAITGLNPNAIYYYRLKGVAAGYNNFYGNMRQLYTGGSEIPNWDFQYWQQDTFAIPNYWKAITDNMERVPGHSGNYAAKISQLNALILGNHIDQQPSLPEFCGGQSLHFRPDSIQAYLNYFISAGDTGYLLVHMYSGTNIICDQFYPIAGNSGGSFIKYSFPVTYNSSAVPDSVVLAFVSSNLFADGGSNYMQNYLSIDDVSFYPPTVPVQNGNFENWFPFVLNYPLAWGYSSLYYTEPTSSGYDPMVSQALFTGPADYAIEVKNNLVNGFLTGADVLCNIGPLHKNKPTFPVLAKHITLNGYYTFYPVGGDTMAISIAMYKNGQEIGRGQLTETDSVTSFRAFDVPINYYAGDSSAIPDSAGIQIACRTRFARGTSRLQLDKLSFDGFTSVNETPVIENTIKVYPNPAQSSLVIEAARPLTETDFIQLLDINGRIVTEIKPATGNKTVLDISKVNGGFYILRIQSVKSIYNQKVAVIK